MPNLPQLPVYDFAGVTPNIRRGCDRVFVAANDAGRKCAIQNLRMSWYSRHENDIWRMAPITHSKP
jgi:hypothetical protein